MTRKSKKLVSALAAALLGVMLAFPVNCNVQYPPSNTQTIWGVAIALPA